MVLQIDAEQQDTLEGCSATARRIAKHFDINVTFYFDRIGYYVTPVGDVSTMKSTLETVGEKKGK